MLGQANVNIVPRHRGASSLTRGAPVRKPQHSDSIKQPTLAATDQGQQAKAKEPDPRHTRVCRQGQAASGIERRGIVALQVSAVEVAWTIW